MPLSFQIYSVLIESAKNRQLKSASKCAFFAPKRTFQLVIIPNITQIHFTPDLSINTIVKMATPTQESIKILQGGGPRSRAAERTMKELN